MKTLIVNAVTAILGVLAALGLKVPSLDASTMTAIVGAIATIVAVLNQIVHFYRDQPPQISHAKSHKHRGFARLLMLVILAVGALVLLTGCAGWGVGGVSNMTAEQITAAAKDKSASVACGTGTGPWGKVNTVYLNIDRTSVTNGVVTVDDACKVTVTTAQKPAAAQ